MFIQNVILFTKHDLKQWYMFIILYFYCTSIFTIFGVNLMGSSKNVDHPAINTNVRVFKKIKSQYRKKTNVPWIENRQTRTNALNLIQATRTPTKIRDRSECFGKRWQFPPCYNNFVEHTPYKNLILWTYLVKQKPNFAYKILEWSFTLMVSDNRILYLTGLP